MRKGLLLAPLALLAALLGASLTQGATGGPDAGGYTFIDNQEANGPAFDFVDISGTGTVSTTSSCDDCVQSGVPIGFTFSFYGSPYTTANISSNGNLQFTTANAFWGNSAFPTSTFGPAIAPWWDDLWTACDSTDRVLYQTSGSPGARRFIIQWDVVNHISLSCATERITFQTILLEGTNEILFQYADAEFSDVSYTRGASATVGIQRDSGVGLQYSFDTPSLANGRAICYRPSGTNPNVVCNRTVGSSRPRVNVGGAAAPLAGLADQARDNRQRAATAAQPAATVQPPRTGTGVTISPPNTGDAGLASQRDSLTWRLAVTGVGFALAASLRLARRT